MATTALIVELVIIGFQVLIWMSILLVLVFGYHRIDFCILKEWKDWTTMIFLTAAASSYTLGSMFNVVATQTVDRLLLSTSSFKSLYKELSYSQMVTHIALTNIDLFRHFETRFSQVRLLRATVLNLPLIGILSIVLVITTGLTTRPLRFTLLSTSFLVTVELIAIYAWKVFFYKHSSEVVGAYRETKA